MKPLPESEETRQAYLSHVNSMIDKAAKVFHRLVRGEALTIKTIGEVFGHEVVYPLIYVDAFYKPTVGMMIHCQKCGHEWNLDKCEACPFGLFAWKDANTRNVITTGTCRVCGHSRTSHQAGQCSGAAFGACRCAEYL